MAMQGLWQDEKLTLAHEFLAERGVHPDERGEYRQRDITDAIRVRGWEPEISGGTGKWTVELCEQVDMTWTCYPAACEPDLSMALLRALNQAVAWMTDEEAHRRFDEEARRVVGMSGEEFRRRWRAGEVDGADPTIRHLLMSRPRGW